MIQPEAYYAAHKRCHNPEELGRLGFILVGRGDELTPPPSSLELSFAETLIECNEWHTENREAIKEKWRKQKAEQRKCPADNKMSTNVRKTSADTTMSTTLSPSPSLSLTHSLSNTDTDIDIGFGLCVDDCESEISKSDGDSIFDPSVPAEVVCAAITGDKKARKRWASAVKKLGEQIVRQECYAMFREFKQGEEPKNRGAALNARLKKLEGK